MSGPPAPSGAPSAPGAPGGAARVAALDALAAEIAAAHGRAPRFDPAGGGTEARILLLLETPGPDPRTGAAAVRTVSPLNATGTARNLRRFLAEAGVDPAELVVWNAVPFVIHAAGARNRSPRAAERAAGLRWIAPLLRLLPELRVAVLAGRTAGAAHGAVEAARPGLPVLRMPHPSPNAVAADPDAARKSIAALAEARRIAREGGPARTEPPPPATPGTVCRDAEPAIGPASRPLPPPEAGRGSRAQAEPER